jgi:phosphoglycerol transferase
VARYIVVVDLREQAGAADRSGTSSPASLRTRARSDRRLDALWCSSAAIIALIAAAIDLKLWRASLHLPMAPSGSDSNFVIAIVKGMLEHGWIFSNPDIGAPFGTQFYDYPVGLGEVLHIAVMRMFGFVSDDPVAIVNVFYVLTYPLVAASAFAVLRALRFPRGISLVCAVLYALLPYHFLRGEVHLTLSAYYGVPLACWLILASMGHDELFRRRMNGQGRLRGWLSRRTILTAVTAIVVGSATLYYALFAVMLLVICAFVAFIVHRDRRRLLQAGLVTCIVLAVIVVSESPALVYQQKHGKNTAVAVRSPVESEVYGLKLAYMVFPRPGHRLSPFANLGGKYMNNPLPGEGFSPSLGLAGTIGLLVAVLSLVSRGLRVRRVEAGKQSSLMASSGLAALVAFLLGTVGGGSALLAYGISSQIRGWDRISVYISFFALVALALLLVRLSEFVGQRARLAVAPVLGVVLVFGYLDQTTNYDAPNYSAVAAQWRVDSRFGHAIQQVAPAGTQILQLPYVPFPENPPVHRMSDYDLFRGYLHTNDLKWTYGAMKGRSQDWLASHASDDVSLLLPAAVGAGFRGLYLDQYGYADGGALITWQIVATLGYNNAILSSDGRLVYFDLRRYAQALARRVPSAEEELAGQALIHPTATTFSGGFYGTESDGTSTWRWMKEKASVALANTVGRPKPVSVSAVLSPPTPGPTTVTVRWPDGRRQTLGLKKAKRVRRTLTLPPGSSTLAIQAVGPAGPLTAADARDRRLQVVNLTVTDVALQRLQRDAKR